jgi:hypothetical protein
VRREFTGRDGGKLVTDTYGDPSAPAVLFVQSVDKPRHLPRRYVDTKDAGHIVAGDVNDAFTNSMLEFLYDTKTGGKYDNEYRRSHLQPQVRASFS